LRAAGSIAIQVRQTLKCLVRRLQRAEPFNQGA
jgi:hypothetical protein